MTRLHFVLKTTNVLVYLFFLSSTVYSVVGPVPDDDTLAKHLTYITPAPWVNYVWSLIHLLLAGYVIAQWFEDAHESVIAVGWHFVIATLLNSLWLVMWQKGHLVFALVSILLTASSVSYVFYTLETNHPTSKYYVKLFIHAPFSLWHGWVVFVSTLNVFATFTTVQDDGPNTLHIILAIAGIVFLGSTAVGYVEFKKRRGDVVGALVLAWGLFGIYAKQENVWIHWVAFAEGIFATLYPVKPYVARLFGGRTDEQAPLLG